MADGHLITNGSIETITAFEMLSEQLQRMHDYSYRWKWAILAMHSGLQGLMVLALQGSNGLRVLKPEDAALWLDAHEKGKPYPSGLELDNFLNLYKKIKSDVMLLYVHSRKFHPKDSQGSSIKLLNRIRNEYVHFAPSVWALELKGLPQMMLDTLDIAEFLAWKSGNVFWTDGNLQNRIEKAIETSRVTLKTLNVVYNSASMPQ